MRTLLAAVLLVGLASAAPPPPAPNAPAPTLKVGDPAPPLKVTDWMQGKAVKAFEKDKVYVVEFWATWCGPCIVMMPHLAELQAEYKEKGVTFIGFTSKDENGNTRDKVAEFVKKRGPKLPYTFAYADDDATNDAYMKASGQAGIPCSFVVGKDGRLAFIGHPMYLDLVLPKVVAGTWVIEKDTAELGKVEAELDAVFGALDKEPAEAVKALDAFDAKYPALGGIPYLVAPRIDTLLKVGRFADAKKRAEVAIDKATKFDDTMVLRGLAGALRSPAAKDQKELLALSLKAAEAVLASAGDKSVGALVGVALSHHAAGNADKAADFAKKAIAAAGDDTKLKESAERQLADILKGKK